MTKMAGRTCGEENPSVPGMLCERTVCVEYHANGATIWTEGASPMPSRRADPVTASAILRRARARVGDPETSHQAAASVGDLTAGQSMVYEALRREGPMHDEMIYAAVRAVPGNHISLSGCRTRRSELVELGLVEDGGDRAVTGAGRSTIVWCIRSSESA